MADRILVLLATYWRRATRFLEVANDDNTQYSARWQLPLPTCMPYCFWMDKLGCIVHQSSARQLLRRGSRKSGPGVL